MANVIINDTHLKDIANAIRTKKGTVNKIYPKDMATEISGISTGTDTSDATATTSDILQGKTAYANGKKITGTISSRNGWYGEITSKNQEIIIPEGYHNGTSTSVSIDLTERSKIIPQNIKKGVNILGVYGTHEGNNGVNTSDATAVADNILYGKTAYVNGGKVTGTMPDKSNAGTVFISNANVITRIPKGYYDGTAKVDIDSNSYRNLHSDNIREGITILGVTGTMKTSQSGARAMSGTTTSQNIVTGLNKIDYFFLYTDKIYSIGVVSLSFNQAKNECSLTFCGDYSVYSKYCNTVIKKPFIVSGGDIVWTESMTEYCFMSGVAYNWVAIGS